MKFGFYNIAFLVNLTHGTVHVGSLLGPNKHETFFLAKRWITIGYGYRRARVMCYLTATLSTLYIRRRAIT